MVPKSSGRDSVPIKADVLKPQMATYLKTVLISHEMALAKLYGVSVDSTRVGL